MISDNDLYSLAVFLGALAMLLIVLYHFLEVNAVDDTKLAGHGHGHSSSTVSGIQSNGSAKPARAPLASAVNDHGNLVAPGSTPSLLSASASASSPALSAGAPLSASPSRKGGR